MRDLIKQTYEQIQDILDDTMYSVDVECDDYTLTRDTIEDFKNGICKKFGSSTELSDIDSSVKIMISENIQLKKGQARFDLLVLDFGKVRMCFKV